MRADSFNFHVDPVRTKMTGTQHIHISRICSMGYSKSKGIITDENLSQVCSADKRESEIITVNEISMEDSESESVHKSINTNKGKYPIANAVFTSEKLDKLDDLVDAVKNLKVNNAEYY